MLEYIKIPLDFKAYTSALNYSEKGRLIDALVEYATTNKVPIISGNERFLFPYFKELIDDQKIKLQRNKGENHWNWKGGITSKAQIERNSKKYSDWRKSVFSRDNYTCQLCGLHGGKLNAHHKKKWSEYPELRFMVDNGITLCESCHKAVHRNELSC